MAPPAANQSVLGRIPTWGKALVMAGAVALTAGTYWFIFYSDTAAKIEGARKQRKALNDELMTQQQAQQSYFADTDELGRREKRAKELNKVLPPDSQEDAFLSAVQSSANAAGIDLKGYSPVEESAQSFYAKVPMKLEMTGKFHQIAKFAFELGKADRIINVENIELTDPKIVGDDVVLKAKCLATAFHALKPKETPRGPGTPGTPAAPGTPGTPGAPGAPPAGPKSPSPSPEGSK
jgi:type IV pilus assembly protein PilO